MAHPRLPDSARVPVGLTISEAEAMQIDQVLARPEFAGWTRPQWCREIIRSALRYYAGNARAPDPGEARGSGRPEPSQPVSPGPPPAPEAAGSPAPAASASGPAAPPAPADAAPAAPPEPPAEPESSAEFEPPAEPEPSDSPECAHPADAWNYDTGTCGVCGAVL
jgi:hypothetical protein